ncbi:MAG: FGGY family carbohydrate kinase [Erysipelotrichaceae bacterium]|nr:FGGY family carbohydrate kinase [Erysipelotrichaceae bacterium]
MTLAGLDIGTTGAKIVYFSPDGRNLGKDYLPYPSLRNDSKQELDPKVLRDTLFALFYKAALAHPDLTAIGITSFGESFVCLGEHDEPLFPILLYTDKRGKAEKDWLVSRLGEDKIIAKTGLRPHEMYSLPKLAYWKQNEPEKYAKIRHVLLMQDYAFYLLTGETKIDYSLATRTLGFSLETNSWDEEIFSALDLNPSLFSLPVASGSFTRGIRKEVANACGLPKDILVLLGGHDQFACALGSGVLAPDEAMEGAGTVEAIVPLFQKTRPNSVYAKDHYAVVPYGDRGYLAYGFSYTGGALSQWFIDKIAPLERAKAKAEGKNIYEELCSSYKGMPTGILCLPHFAGAATPYMDLGSRGVFAGLSLSTNKSDLYLAVLEGVAYEMRLNLERMEKDGIPVGTLYATGGGSKNPIWNQIKADITNHSIVLLDGEEAGARGCAMQAAIAEGIYSSLEEAKKAFVHPLGRVVPSPMRHAAYNEIYASYEKLYAAIRPLWEK